MSVTEIFEQVLAQHKWHFYILHCPHVSQSFVLYQKQLLVNFSIYIILNDVDWQHYEFCIKFVIPFSYQLCWQLFFAFFQM